MSGTTVKWEGHLLVSVNRGSWGVEYAKNWKASAKLSVGKPSVGRDEVAVKIAVELPSSLFVRPQLEAKITVPDHQVTPLTINLETMDNIAALIQQSTGFDVRIVADGKEGA